MQVRKLDRTRMRTTSIGFASRAAGRVRRDGGIGEFKAFLGQSS